MNNDYFYEYNCMDLSSPTNCWNAHHPSFYQNDDDRLSMSTAHSSIDILLPSSSNQQQPGYYSNEYKVIQKSLPIIPSSTTTNTTMTTTPHRTNHYNNDTPPQPRPFVSSSSSNNNNSSTTTSTTNSSCICTSHCYLNIISSNKYNNNNNIRIKAFVIQRTTTIITTTTITTPHHPIMSSIHPEEVDSENDGGDEDDDNVKSVSVASTASSVSKTTNNTSTTTTNHNHKKDDKQERIDHFIVIQAWTTTTTNNNKNKKPTLLSSQTISFPSPFLVQLFQTNTNLDNNDDSNISFYCNVTHSPSNNNNNNDTTTNKQKKKKTKSSKQHNQDDTTIGTTTRIIPKDNYLSCFLITLKQNTTTMEHETTKKTYSNKKTKNAKYNNYNMTYTLLDFKNNNNNNNDDTTSISLQPSEEEEEDEELQQKSQEQLLFSDMVDIHSPIMRLKLYHHNSNLFFLACSCQDGTVRIITMSIPNQNAKIMRQEQRHTIMIHHVTKFQVDGTVIAITFYPYTTPTTTNVLFHNNSNNFEQEEQKMIQHTSLGFIIASLDGFACMYTLPSMEQNNDDNWMGPFVITKHLKHYIMTTPGTTMLVDNDKNNTNNNHHHSHDSSMMDNTHTNIIDSILSIHAFQYLGTKSKHVIAIGTYSGIIRLYTWTSKNDPQQPDGPSLLFHQIWNYQLPYPIHGIATSTMTKKKKNPFHLQLFITTRKSFHIFYNHKKMIGIAGKQRMNDFLQLYSSKQSKIEMETKAPTNDNVDEDKPITPVIANENNYE